MVLLHFDKDINNYMNHIALLDEYQDKKLESTDMTLLRDTKKQLQEFHETILGRFENLIDSGIASNLNSLLSDAELKRAYDRRIKAVALHRLEPFLKEELETDLDTLANNLMNSFDVEIRKIETFQSFLYATFINGYTQNKIGQILNVNQGTVSRWMRGSIKIIRVRSLVMVPHYDARTNS